MLRMHQIYFSPRLHPGPRCESSRRSPNLVLGWKGPLSLPVSHALDVYDISSQRLRCLTLS